MTNTPQTFTRCNENISSDCIYFNSNPISCAGICFGANLTEVLTVLANGICSLNTTTSLTGLQIPSCLQAAYGVLPVNLFNSIQIIENQVCTNAVAIANITSQLTTLDPLVTLNFGCCSTNPCVVNGQVSTTVAFTNLIACICTQNTTIDNLQAALSTANSNIISLQQQVLTLQTSLLALQTNFNAFATLVAGSTSSTDTGGLVGRVNCIVTTLNNNNISTTC